MGKEIYHLYPTAERRDEFALKQLRVQEAGAIPPCGTVGFPLSPANKNGGLSSSTNF
jgi:hypothetical protein